MAAPSSFPSGLTDAAADAMVETVDLLERLAGYRDTRTFRRVGATRGREAIVEVRMSQRIARMRA
jgi:hypothetical protein